MLATGGALGLSLCLHTLLVVLLVWASERLPSRTAERPPREQPDVWRGRTLDVDTVVAPAVPLEPPRATERESTPAAASPTPAVTSPAPGEPPDRPEPVASTADRAAPEQPDAVFREPPRSDPARAEGQPGRPKPKSAVIASGDELDAGPSAPSQPFGAEVAEGPARQFAKAFARALPPAIRSDPSFQTASTELDLEFSLKAFFGPDGRVDRIETTPLELPERVERLCRKTLLFLGIGRFAHSEESARSGSQTLYLAMELDDEPVTEDLPRIAYDPPSARQPGRALYTFESGRTVTLWIALEASVLERRQRSKSRAEPRARPAEAVPGPASP